MPPSTESTSHRPRYSRPKTRRDWKFFVRLLFVPTIALLCGAGLLYQEHHFKHEKQSSWTTVMATVEDTRLHPIARFAFEYGSKDLYEVDVQASYSLNGVPQKEWLALSDAPKPRSEATLESVRLKGSRCVVRWSPSNPDQKIAELQ